MSAYAETISMDTAKSILKIDFGLIGEDRFNQFLSYGVIVYQNDNGFLITLALTCDRTAVILTSTFVGEQHV